ncbi:MAG TPA: PA14 domain-containing protein, partial [bacterium]|nr:PA14 domain-containing protein [bacterium]
AVRWIGNFTFAGGRYRFTTVTDDGVRIYLDDVLILDSWRPMRGTRSAVKTIAEGEHTVRVEYFEAMEAAKAQVYWTWLGSR